jgi:hypothetical protein
MALNIKSKQTSGERSRSYQHSILKLKDKLVVERSETTETTPMEELAQPISKGRFEQVSETHSPQSRQDTKVRRGF